MPIYEYVCEGCGYAFEFLVRSGDKPVCPSCGMKKLAKQFSAPAAPHTAATTSAPQACPQRQECPAKHCCGQNCGMGEFM